MSPAMKERRRAHLCCVRGIADRLPASSWLGSPQGRRSLSREGRTMAKSVIIAAVLAVILTTALTSAYVPAECEPLAKEHGAEWLETHEVLRETFRC